MLHSLNGKKIMRFYSSFMSFCMYFHHCVIIGDSEEDWPLEVIKYDGKREKILLNPGEMLLYESAKLIHGRPESFKGKLYVNLFVHFTETENWDFMYGKNNTVFSQRRKIYYRVSPPEGIIDLDYNDIKDEL